MNNRLARTGALALLLLAAGHARAELAVIAHPGVQVPGISREELKDIWLARNRSFADGMAAERVDQEADTPARQQFNRDVLQMDESERKAHWARLVFAGRARPPQVAAGDEAVKRWVAANPGAIGYVQGKFVDGSVKVLLILP